MPLARYALSVVLILSTSILHHLNAPAPWQFLLAAGTIIPLAGEITRATNRLAHELGPLLGGLLNASAANLTELIFTGLSLAAGLTYLVQATLLGAVISNLLLVLGLAMVVGGRNHTHQQVSATLANTSSSQLLVALVALALPSAAREWGDGWPRGPSALFINGGIALALLTTYILSTWYALAQSLRRPADRSDPPRGCGDQPKHSLQRSTKSEKEDPTRTGRGRRRGRLALHLTQLLLAAAAVGWVSEILIATVPGTIQAWRLNPRFIGLIVLPLLGNAIENVAAVLAARDGRMTLAYEIAVGSSTQITLFVLPVLILAGLALGRPLSLAFPPLETLAVAAAILLVTLVYSDARSNWVEGAQLLATYVVLALVFLTLK